MIYIPPNVFRIADKNNRMNASFVILRLPNYQGYLSSFMHRVSLKKYANFNLCRPFYI